jgi:hypothetical protein
MGGKYRTLRRAHREFTAGATEKGDRHILQFQNPAPSVVDPDAAEY